MFSVTASHNYLPSLRAVYDFFSMNNFIVSYSYVYRSNAYILNNTYGIMVQCSYTVLCNVYNYKHFCFHYSYTALNSPLIRWWPTADNLHACSACEHIMCLIALPLTKHHEIVAILFIHIYHISGMLVCHCNWFTTSTSQIGN